MSFFDNIMRGLNLDGGMCPISFRITFIGKNCLFIEGAVKIVKLTGSEVTVRLNGAAAIIKGENLKIKSFAGGDLTMTGDIKSVERV